MQLLWPEDREPGPPFQHSKKKSGQEAFCPVLSEISMKSSCPTQFSRIQLYLIGLLLLFSGFVGCSSQIDAPVAPEAKSPEVRVSPTQFFVGDLKKLEPHLAMRAGAVHLEIDAQEIWVKCEVEYWQAGKKVGFTNGATRHKKGQVDASFSLTEINGPKGVPQYRITDSVGGDSSTVARDRPEPGKDGMTQNYVRDLKESVSLPKDHSEAVWAYLIYETTDPSPPKVVREGTIKEAAKEAKWAVVFKLGWKDIEKP